MMQYVHGRDSTQTSLTRLDPDETRLGPVSSVNVRVKSDLVCIYEAGPFCAPQLRCQKKKKWSTAQMSKLCSTGQMSKKKILYYNG